jgi:hypothetical protein
MQLAARASRFLIGRKTLRPPRRGSAIARSMRRGR